MLTTVEKLIRDAVSELEVTEKVASSAFSKPEAEKVSQGLAKVAGFKYAAIKDRVVIDEKAYNSTCEIMKIASGVIDETVAEIDKVNERVKSLEKVAEIRGMIDELLDTGQIDRSEVQEKTAEFLKKDEREIEIVKEAMNLISKGAKNFFESDDADGALEKRGMFDSVIDA